MNVFMLRDMKTKKYITNGWRSNCYGTPRMWKDRGKLIAFLGFHYSHYCAQLAGLEVVVVHLRDDGDIVAAMVKPAFDFVLEKRIVEVVPQTKIAQAVRKYKK